MDELGTLSPGYQLRVAAQPDPEGQFGLVRLGDVSDDGIDEGELLRMNLEIDVTKYQIERGDVLCRSRGGNYKAAVVGDLCGLTIALSPLYILRANPSLVMPEFIAWWLNLPEMQNALEAAAIGSNIKTVPIAKFGEVPVPWVPLEVQGRVVEIDRLNREERRLELELAEKRAVQVERKLAEVVQRTAVEKGR